MRSISALFLILSSPVDAQSPSRRCDKASKEVRAVEKAWLAAYETRDSDQMSRVLATGFTITHPNGSVQSRQDLLSGLQRRRDTPGPRFFTTDVQASCARGVVVLTGWVAQEGRVERSRARYTDTYVRIGRRWQVLASHLSRP